MKRILLHVCCGPCTFYPLKQLRSAGWEVIALFYNPNIHPYSEWLKRRDALEEMAQASNLRTIILNDYPLEEFLRSIVFRESNRCVYCHTVRLEATARLAKKSGFDSFTTTLLYSKRQKHELVKTVAESAAKKARIPFYYKDFRSGWKEGQLMAEKAGIYRQQYCGCIFSEKERFYRHQTTP